MKPRVRTLHRPDSAWRPAQSRRNEGIDARYSGPLLAALMAAPTPAGRLVAWDPVRESARWTVDHPVLMSGGVLATAGNLVFQGRSDGILLAYRATDGAKLWEFDAGTGIMAPPVTYLVGGRQYITLGVGWGGDMGLFNPPTLDPVRPGFSRILTFAIGGTATLTPPAFGHTGPPAPPIEPSASAQTISEGRALYDTYCVSCHGIAVIASTLPDLRYATAETHRRFDAIVLNGERQSLGMPSFGDLLTAEQAHAIQAYVLSRAAEAARQSPR